MVDARAISKLVIVLVGAAVALGVGILLFGLVPEETTLGLADVVLVLALATVGLWLSGRVADAVVADYDVAEVEVDGVITRDGRPGGLPVSGAAASANDLVEQIERGDEDGDAEALIVKLNTPGGQVVPSEDIRKAAADFDGPTVAYAEDKATSGGYWIASGCDEFHARRGSMVGSIGVIGSQLGRSELADKVGLDYRRFVSGDFKDSPSAWRELRPEEQEYYQGLMDAWYEQFVDTVVEGRDMDPEFVRDTEARVYHGERAEEIGLVDRCGSREEMEERLADRLGVDEIAVGEFEPRRGLTERMGAGARSVAYALGAGIASAVVDDDTEVDVRV
ncbi:signal peptide peptidase SppA [Halobacteriales archaeon QS_1_68_20]|nr:MAG: signal peptide peptidase SppA [Halobacteriales archaeon QS_1_68_20]